MKKLLCTMITAVLALALVACDGGNIFGGTEKPQATASAFPSPDINPVPSPKIDPPTPTPEPSVKPKTGALSMELKDLIHTDYQSAVAQVQDKHVTIEADDTGKLVKCIFIDGECDYTIDGTGYGIPYGHTTMRLAERYGDAVWGDDSYAAFEIPGLQATVGIFTEDGETASRVEIRSLIYY